MVRGCTGPSEWGERNGENCSAETLPAHREKYYGACPHPAQVVLKRVLRRMSKAVYLLKITSLSQLRKDGHLATYGYGGHKGMDCTHWCLPRVPDTWNELQNSIVDISQSQELDL
jgi:hypothetical protein